METKRNLNAYYFGFGETGEDFIDAILEAVADAGHSSHHTESWSDGEFGESLADEIQRAAQKAADRLSEQQQVIDELVRALEPFAAEWERKKARYKARGGNLEEFPDTHPTSCAHFSQGKYRAAASALSRAKEAGK